MQEKLKNVCFSKILQNILFSCGMSNKLTKNLTHSFWKKITGRCIRFCLRVPNTASDENRQCVRPDEDWRSHIWHALVSTGESNLCANLPQQICKSRQIAAIVSIITSVKIWNYQFEIVFWNFTPPSKCSFPSRFLGDRSDAFWRTITYPNTFCWQ
jgi:hypothetical protein